MKKISVIIPLYNLERLIGRCLESIISQTYSNLEIIVVNDASSDSSADVVKEYAEQDSRIKLIEHNKNKGLFHARITGIENATGDYIAFVDSDDYISEDFYRSLVEAGVRSNDADIVIGKLVHEDEKQYRYIHNRYNFMRVGNILGDDVMRRYWEQEGYCFIWHTVWNKLYKKSLWDKALPILKKQDKHLIMCEDFVFSSVIFSFAKSVCDCEYGCYYYYQHSGASTSGNGNVKKYEKNISDLITSFNFIEKFVIESGFDDEIKEHFYNWKRLYLLFWRDNVRNALLTSSEKRSLRRRLDAFSKDDTDDIIEPSYFYTTSTAYDMRYNELVSKLLSDDIEAVSLDIFDTAILRPFYKPSDMFELMNDKFRELARSVKAPFSDIRAEAERKARAVPIEDAEDIPRNDLTSLDDIYAFVEADYGKEIADTMKAVEIENELRYCSPRKSILNIYNMLKAVGKKIYFTSDMYLPSRVIEKMLAKCGYDGYNGLLISCDRGASKSYDADLFKLMLRDAEVTCEQAFHIGDNWHSDCEMASSIGLEYMHYPKATDCLLYNIGNMTASHAFVGYKEPIGGSFVNYEKALNYFGTRCALAVAANHVYDNPFISFNPYSDMNASPEFLGYTALGMHMLGFTKWFTETALREEYDKLLFIARDGYLPMKAYEIISDCYKNAPKAEYVYTSRKAALAAEISTVEDVLALKDKMNVKGSTPSKLISILAPITDTKACGALMSDKPFETDDDFERFAYEIAKRIDTERAKKYSIAVKNYLEGYLSDKCAMIDIGYSGRTQELVYRTVGKAPDAFYLHKNGGECRKRERTFGFKVHSFYEYTPSITGASREIMYSRIAPSCTGYSYGADGIIPTFEEASFPYSFKYLISELQSNALLFIKDFVNCFADRLDIMDMRNIDISLPLEYFIHFIKPEDARMFSCCVFEDDMWMGHSVTLSEQWMNDSKYHGHRISTDTNNRTDEASEADREAIAYDAFFKFKIDKMGKFKKALFWYLIDKDLFKKKLKKRFKK